MESLTVRHLPYWIASGPQQMAADEAMLIAAGQGRASFRLYEWTEPTVSLGYFQSHRVIKDTGLADLSLVRRSTGGLTLVHHHELTYSLALPALYALQPPTFWLKKIHGIIRDFLLEPGVDATLASSGVMVVPCQTSFEEYKPEAPAKDAAFPSLALQACTPQTQLDRVIDKYDFLCFRHITPGDLIIGRSKIVGSAQRRHHGALLQHGALLLGTSPYTPTLPGIEELSRLSLSKDQLCQAFPEHLKKDLGWDFQAGDWSKSDSEMIERLVKEKYSSQSWNEKR